jgi:hypothetical protein
MVATMAREGELRVVRLRGMLRKAELDTLHQDEAEVLPADTRVNVLVIAEAFEGWHRGDQWGDVSFIATYGDRIDKIALVAEPRWEAQLLMFTGAGFRRTQIKFFPSEQLAEARAWLTEAQTAA